jgi:hypothetical protein
MSERGEDTSLLDALEKIVSCRKGAWHYARYTPGQGGLISGVRGSDIRELIKQGFEIRAELHQTRFADSIVLITNVPDTHKKRAKITFKDDKGVQYQCITEPDYFTCTLYLHNVGTNIVERKAGSTAPEEGQLKDKVGVLIYKNATVIYASHGQLLFGKVVGFTGKQRCKVEPWERPGNDYVAPESCLVVDSNMSKNIMKLKLLQN